LRRWQEELQKDPAFNFKALLELPEVMSDVLKAQSKLSNDYMKYMAEHVFSLKERRG
jgi:hypothetical protein